MGLVVGALVRLVLEGDEDWVRVKEDGAEVGFALEGRRDGATELGDLDDGEVVGLLEGPVDGGGVDLVGTLVGAELRGSKEGDAVGSEEGDAVDTIGRRVGDPVGDFEVGSELVGEFVGPLVFGNEGEEVGGRTTEGLLVAEDGLEVGIADTGVREGLEVGTTVGFITDGAELGDNGLEVGNINVGDREGDLVVGFREGFLVGIEEVNLVGLVEGNFVGADEGNDVRVCEVNNVGACEGIFVGTCEGSFVDT